MLSSVGERESAESRPTDRTHPTPRSQTLAGLRVVSYSFEMSNKAASSGGVQSVGRAVTILEIIARAELAEITQVAEVAATGFALVDDELEVGLTAVSAPVRTAHGAHGDVIASISASGPSFWFTADEAASARDLLTRAAADAEADPTTRVQHRGRGSRISPDVYSACGNSGAIQRMVEESVRRRG